MAGNNGDRTEKPTARRRKDAREKGQVARSRDLTSALSLAGVTIALGWFGAHAIAAVAARLAAGLQALGESPRATIHSGDLALLFWRDAGLITTTVGPMAVIAGVVSVAAGAAQIGFSYSPKAMHLNWSRLNPATGLQRLVPTQAGVELLKALVGLAALGGAAYLCVRPAFEHATSLTGMPPGEAARAGWGLVMSLLWRASLVLVVLGGADYAIQRWRTSSQLKMTRQEVRDESRMSDGNPEIKSRVRRVQREMTKKRMLQSVKTATVVVTNPTHFAVALQYTRAQMAAPVVVAKGQDLLAKRIREIAREHNVPIVENVALARALYKTADVGDAIPADLFGAVAEVLAYLVRLKQLVL